MKYIVTQAHGIHPSRTLGECDSMPEAVVLAQQAGATGRPRAETTDRWRMTDARGWRLFHIQRR